MAQVVVTVKIMPESPEIDLEKVKETANEKVNAFSGGDIGKSEVEPVAFGLNSLNLIFVMDENIGSTDSLEKELNAIEGVNSAEVTDVRRALG